MEFGVMVSPVPRQGTMQQMVEANERILETANRNGWGLWFVDHLQQGEMPYLECWTQMVHTSARFPESDRRADRALPELPESRATGEHGGDAAIPLRRAS